MQNDCGKEGGVWNPTCKSGLGDWLGEAAAAKMGLGKKERSFREKLANSAFLSLTFPFCLPPDNLMKSSLLAFLSPPNYA